MPTLNIDESLIRQNTTDQSFQRGQEYARSQAVRDLIWRDLTLQASVAGSRPYRVAIRFNAQRGQSATCSCSYDFGGWCKHIVAVLLVGMQQPDRIEERPGLDQILERLDLAQTRKLLHNLAAKVPDLIDRIDYEVELITASKGNTAKVSKSKVNQAGTQRVKIDRTPFRRLVSSILRDALRSTEYGYDYDEDPLSGVLDGEVEKAKQFIEAGDSFRAFVMLYAIAEGLSEYVDEIQEYYGDLSDLVWNTDEAMSEAILWTDFSVEERQKWKDELEGTQDLLGTGLDLSLAALAQGWDDPQVQAALRGEQSDDIPNEERSPSENFVYRLGNIRLRILQAQERFDEYLNFAKATHNTLDYVNMLLQRGRLDEAIAAAENVQNGDEAFIVAKKLLEYSAEKQALHIASKGLLFQAQRVEPYRSAELASWTANLAERLGEVTICLNAKITAFKLIPSLKDYHKIRDLAKEQWSSMQKDLLKHLKTDRSWGPTEAKVDIFLEEGMLDAAIAIADTSSCRNHTRLRVMQAAIAAKPKWVISKAQALAEDILNQGKSDAYTDAIAWLEQVRNGYLALKKEKEWRNYRDQLTSKYGRKRKFMDLLNRNGLQT